MHEAPPVIDRSFRGEQERLLGHDIEFEDMTARTLDNKASAYMDNEHREETDGGHVSGVDGTPDNGEDGQAPPVYRVYKRRWFGLLQLVLMNIIVSWDWLSFSPVANTAAEYFSTTSSIINWLSTAFLFAFVVAAPFTIYALHRGGPRLALITSSLLILSGNWIRYAGTRASPPRFPVTMFGQILIGLAQPFVLSAPTHYSSLCWTTNPLLRLLSSNANFILLLFPFAIYVGLFNALSSLLTQILTPYAFTEESSGIAGAILILVGLAASAISSPIVDKYKTYLPFIRTLVPITALCYLAFIWAPGTRSLAAPYTICAILGASSFSLVPVALEWAVEITYPAGPEAGSTICWSGGQVLGGVFIVISDALKEDQGKGDPKGNMGKA
ncbi:MAG: hypothetical protein Q9215_007702, partial [Flavoplaca cf. flavocitrina]